MALEQGRTDRVAANDLMPGKGRVLIGGTDGTLPAETGGRIRVL